ncbi:hypothetical protein ACOMHN_042274 [Nucella lapillus]
MGKLDGETPGGGTPQSAKEEKILPTTLEQFLEAEKLSDWPYPMALEGPLDIQGEGLLLGTQDDIAEILRESAPLGLGLLDDLEDRLNSVEDKLQGYAVHIVTDDKRPSRLADRLFYSPPRTFMTEASNSDVVKSHYSSRGHKSAPGFRKFWKKLFLSEASAAVMQDTFWWIFLSQFNKEMGLEEEKDLLFDRIADSYVALFTSINTDVKDKFLSVYPDCLAQSLYSAYISGFPESRWRFDDQFKQYLINLTHELVTGLKPVPGTWKQWDVAKLRADNDGAAEANAATKKMMEAAALNKKMEVSLDMDSFHKVVGRLGEEADTPQPEWREVSKLTVATLGGPSQSRLAILGNTGPPAGKKVAKESHQIGPGPEYERVKFNTQGRSPLISHYLHMQQLRDFKQPGKKVRRTEIAKMPYPLFVLNPGPTYQQFIQNKMAVSDALSREFTRICESTNAEILELERKKREMYRDIEGLKKELLLVKNPNERKALLDRIADIKVNSVGRRWIHTTAVKGQETAEIVIAV